MKKKVGLIVSLLLVVVMALPLTGCGVSGTYKFESVEMTGEAWEQMPQSMKDITIKAQEAIYSQISFKVDKNTLSITLGEGNPTSVSIELDGSKIKVLENADEFSKYGTMTVQGGKFMLEITEPITQSSVKVVYKKQ